MRFNERELRHYIKSATSQMEGHLSYIISDSKDGIKERKVLVRLMNSLLVMYKVSPNGVFTDMEPGDCIVLTNCTVKAGSNRPNMFNIVSPGLLFDTTFTFLCSNSAEHAQWVSSVRHASGNALETELQTMKSLITKKSEIPSQQQLAGASNSNTLRPSRQPPAPPSRQSRLAPASPSQQLWLPPAPPPQQCRLAPAPPSRQSRLPPAPPPQQSRLPPAPPPQQSRLAPAPPRIPPDPSNQPSNAEMLLIDFS